MRREFTIQSKVDGLVLDGLVVEPEEGVQRTALLQLSHGMSEYKERYLPFMEFMAEHGVVCVIHDHRGHGKSVKSEQDLGFMYGAGGAGLVEDLFLVTKWAKKEYPDLPFVLMGHSMGSLVVRAYAKEHDQELDALIVCGSPSKNYLRPLGAAVGHAEAAVLGDEHRSNLLEAMSFGSFAARFADEKSRFAWCCSLTRFDRKAGRRGHGAWLLQIEDACRIQRRLAHAHAVRHEIAVWNPRNFLPRSRNKRREIFGPAFFCIHTQPGCAGCVVGS